MESYRWSSITTTDVTDWSALIAAISDHDGGDDYYEPDDLAEELTEVGVDPVQDTWAVWNGETIVAWCHVWGPLELDHDGLASCQVEGGVHPDHRRRGLGRALLDRAEARSTAILAGRFPDAEGAVNVAGGPEGAPARSLLEGRGYAIARYFDLLRRTLSEPVAERPTVPEGIVVRAVADDLDGLREPVLVARNDAFRDHWGSSPVTTESWTDRWSSRTGRPDVSVVAVDGAGRVLSYVLCAQLKPRDLYVASVGTVRDARGQGLSRACLVEVLSRAVATGAYDRADLHVDSASQTGATRLYEDLGWEPVRQTAAMRRSI